MVKEALLDRVPIGRLQVHRMKGERPDRDEAARAYAAILPERLDLLVLGLGEDGHTASLFPGAASLAESVRRVLAVNAPAPPRDRLTITPPVILDARLVIGLVAGAKKAGCSGSGHRRALRSAANTGAAGASGTMDRRRGRGRAARGPPMIRRVLAGDVGGTNARFAIFEVPRAGAVTDRPRGALCQRGGTRVGVAGHPLSRRVRRPARRRLFRHRLSGHRRRLRGPQPSLEGQRPRARPGDRDPANHDHQRLRRGGLRAAQPVRRRGGGAPAGGRRRSRTDRHHRRRHRPRPGLPSLGWVPLRRPSVGRRARRLLADRRARARSPRIPREGVRAGFLGTGPVGSRNRAYLSLSRGRRRRRGAGGCSRGDGRERPRSR